MNRDSDEVELERARSRETALEVTFGLKVKVKALKTSMQNSTVRGCGPDFVEATLQDRIIFSQR